MSAIKGSFAIASVIFAASMASAQIDCKDIGGGPAKDYVEGRVLVRPLDKEAFEKEFTSANLKKWLDRYARDKNQTFVSEDISVKPIGTTGAYMIESNVRSTDELLKLKDKAGLVYVYFEPDPVFKAHGFNPNDPAFVDPPEKRMWGLRAIHAPEAWRFGVGTEHTIVAVVDSGIDVEQDDLSPNLWRARKALTARTPSGPIECAVNDFGYDAIAHNCRPNHRSGHGTRVAGILGACGDNGIGLVGVNWNVGILAVTFLDQDDSGCAARAADALETVRLLKTETGLPIRVVNLSWGSGKKAPEIENQLQELAKADVVIVASAGNDGTNNDNVLAYPANASATTLISVAATQPNGSLALFSNYGSRTVHIAAPGQDIHTTDVQDIPAEPFGTSYAAAFVTGAVALVASQCPDLSAIELKNLILDNADKKTELESCIIGGRFLNVEKAAEACEKIRAAKKATGLASGDLSD